MMVEGRKWLISGINLTINKRPAVNFTVRKKNKLFLGHY
jgi:hypothetical protein